MTGKCPKCEKSVSNVAVGHVRMNTGTASHAAFHGVAYLCPFCDTILGVGCDVTSGPRPQVAATPRGPKKRSAPKA